MVATFPVSLLYAFNSVAYVVLIFWAGLNIVRDIVGGIRRQQTILLFHSFALFSLNLLLSIRVALGYGNIQRAGDNVTVNVERWIYYVLSCSLLAASNGEILRLKRLWYWANIVLVAATLVCGYLAGTEADSGARLTYFIAGFFPFLLSLGIMFICKRVHNNATYKIFILWIVTTWSIYPIAFALGPSMYHVISLVFESMIYGIDDWFSKMLFAIFSFYTMVGYYRVFATVNNDNN